MLNKMSQAKKEKHCTVSFVESKKVYLIEVENRAVVTQG
jgi:hypothetical protein